MAGSIVITVYLNNERHKEYEKDKTRYNKVAREALIDTLDSNCILIEEDLTELAQKEIDQEKKEKEQLKDIIEETPLTPVETTEEKKPSFLKKIFN
ncbi:hypothetical protein LCGC14_0625890 [marine sediment metagenome]|uniref:Uncharacterized protein n=1 Tax=marine sediment metagenome TaxID=412755 RepID=A0A0F9R3E5_9ZZZZ